MSFPKDFVWGAAASSYQIEGAATIDGKGLSIWDIFCQSPGKIIENCSGEIACDHYHRFEEDIQLMARIGLRAYRLSISWPRVLPEGRGRINAKGLSFYDRLIDSLLSHNIEPWVTLFHWDYPYQLYHQGGWLNSDSSDWFADYTKVVVDKLSDRVRYWISLNEPQCFIGFGYQTGNHAPGFTLPLLEVLRIAHNVLLAHGKATQVIRSSARKSPRVGIALVGIVKMPKTESSADINFARDATFAIVEKNVWNNSWFTDPMILGHYPKDGLKLFEAVLPRIQSSDMKTIGQELDFCGINVYFGEYAKITNDSIITSCYPGKGHTTMGWPVTPEVLYWGPKFFYERYKLPIVITENGMANCDWIHSDDKVHDPQRIDFLTRHLIQIKRSINDGIPVKGYFVWSILDNFEWIFGFQQRFGLIYVDYSNQKRILKDSAFWYQKIINTNGQCVINENS